jgi:hypothetical protein
MKPAHLIILGLLLFLFEGCKKEKDEFVTGTVIQKGGCYNGSWIVLIDNPDPSKQTFLRSSSYTFPPGSYNCTNSVFIQLPATLAFPNKKIKFSGVKNQGILCLSFSEAPNHIDVKVVTEN